jgi:hypothetical protein
MGGEGMPGAERQMLTELELFGRFKLLDEDAQRGDFAARGLSITPFDRGVFDRHGQRIDLLLDQKVESRFAFFQVFCQRVPELVGGGAGMRGRSVEVRTH